MKHVSTVAAVIAGILLVLAIVRGNSPPHGEPATETLSTASAAPVTHGTAQQTPLDEGPTIQSAVWYYQRGEELGRPINHDI